MLYVQDDLTWNLKVFQPARHKVVPEAVHVPTNLIRKIIREDDIKKIMGMGFPREESIRGLELTTGK